MTTFVKITDLPLASPLTGSELIEIVQSGGSSQTDIHALALAAKQLSGFSGRNRIINGAMMVDQRNNGNEVSVSGAAVFAADRFLSQAAITGKMVSVRVTGVSPALPFESFYRSITSAAHNPSTNDYFTTCVTRIPGFNIRGLGWGTATASPVVLSFWVRASIAGQYGLLLANASSTRTYSTVYTVTAAHTWEFKTIIIPGCTNGTWNIADGIGIQICPDFGSGAAYESSVLDVWGNGPFSCRTSNCVRPITQAGAFLDLTGWQLESGTIATPFDFRSYTETLAQCQMFYQEISSPETYLFTLGLVINGSEIYFPFKNPGGSMIKTPTVTCSGSASDYLVFASGTQYAAPSVPVFAGGNRHAVSLKTQAGGIPNGAAAYLAFNPNTALGKIALSADI